MNKTDDAVEAAALREQAEVIVALNIDSWGWGPIEEIEGLAEHKLAVEACMAGMRAALASRPTETDGLAGELIELLAKATPGDLNTCKTETHGGIVECPACDGEGVVPQDSHYSNFDGVALGVQFYGVGPHFGAHQKLWQWFIDHKETILTALSKTRVDALASDTQGERDKALEDAFADGAWEILKGDYNDLRKQQRLLALFRALKGDRP